MQLGSQEGKGAAENGQAVRIKCCGQVKSQLTSLHSEGFSPSLDSVLHVLPALSSGFRAFRPRSPKAQGSCLGVLLPKLSAPACGVLLPVECSYQSSVLPVECSYQSLVFRLWSAPTKAQVLLPVECSYRS